jgi:hypothetical protein
VKTIAATIVWLLLPMPIGSWAQEPLAPLPDPRDEGRPKIAAAELGKRVAREGCVIKPVMSDEDYRKCGARPPQPQSASVGSSAPR